jgi:hypothetical protein
LFNVRPVAEDFFDFSSSSSSPSNTLNSIQEKITR